MKNLPASPKILDNYLAEEKQEKDPPLPATTTMEIAAAPSPLTPHPLSPRNNFDPFSPTNNHHNHNTNSNLASPQSFDYYYSSTTPPSAMVSRPRAHTANETSFFVPQKAPEEPFRQFLAQENAKHNTSATRPRAHTEEPFLQFLHQANNNNTAMIGAGGAGGLPLAPNLNELPVSNVRPRAHTAEEPHLCHHQQQQQQQTQVVANQNYFPPTPAPHPQQQQPQQQIHQQQIHQQQSKHDSPSTVSSVSNYSWERYQKLQDRYGWVPPPPESEFIPFIPPEFICIVRKLPNEEKDAVTADEIPDWLRDDPSQPSSVQQQPQRKRPPRHERRSRARTLPSMPAIALQADTTTTANASATGGIFVPPPPLEKGVKQESVVHPLLRPVTRALEKVPEKARWIQKHHVGVADSELDANLLFANMMMMTTTEQETNHNNNNNDALSPLLDATSVTSATSSSDNEDQEYYVAIADNDTTKTQFKIPTLWDKCIKSPVQKVLLGHSNNNNHNNNNIHHPSNHNHKKNHNNGGGGHRRCKSYDFVASPSACFS